MNSETQVIGNIIDDKTIQRGSNDDVSAYGQDTSVFIDNMRLGTVAAFLANVKNGNEIVLSGKLTSVIDDQVSATMLFVFQTSNGHSFKVAKENILWVKTGQRWPRWVFEKFKANVKSEVIVNGEKC